MGETGEAGIACAIFKPTLAHTHRQTQAHKQHTNGRKQAHTNTNRHPPARTLTHSRERKRPTHTHTHALSAWASRNVRINVTHTHSCTCKQTRRHTTHNNQSRRHQRQLVLVNDLIKFSPLPQGSSAGRILKQPNTRAGRTSCGTHTHPRRSAVYIYLFTAWQPICDTFRVDVVVAISLCTRLPPPIDFPCVFNRKCNSFHKFVAYFGAAN